ncbi:MAG TPA: glycosyl hydrolase family 65 protein [Solirubrobacteraceae bacterium]|nr:glycosyl hydrolase family 65 protein [Solirubrobacteraceae bacterium]
MNSRDGGAVQNPAFEVDGWTVREDELDLERLAQTESVFALGNGHIGLRGNLDEGEPYGLPGTYLNGFFEFHPMPYAEAGYGNPESGQTLVNVTNAKIIRLLVDDETFDVRYGRLRRHERVLDMRSGLLHRCAEWAAPSGREVRVRTTRMVSFAQRAVVAIRYEVEPLHDDARLVVQSELVANEPLDGRDGDPRTAAALEHPLESEYASHREAIAWLVHHTNRSGLRMAAGMDHLVEGPAGVEVFAESDRDIGRVMVTADVPKGETLRVIKFIAYGWSSQRSRSALGDQVRAALAEARHTGWDGLVEEQRDYLEDFWNRADVEIDGDDELQQAVRFALFHTLQAGARAEVRALPAKGLTGSGYDGHTFWDTEMFVLPVLSYTAPEAARDALRWRYQTLDKARARARTLGLRGAAFPWRTINGDECSGYWPAGTAAFHIGADVADAVVRYQQVSEDDEFARTVGLALLVETARLWHSLGHFNGAGSFRIDGVTGPDEYSAVADNNVYTNLMAQRNLRQAAAAVERYPDEARSLEVESDEAADWLAAADAILIPYDEELEVHPQAELFTRHQGWDFENTSPDQYPLLLNFPYFDLYRKRVVKQADLVLALHQRGDHFSLAEKARDFAYYEQITVRDSSLSACTQAVVAAELGHLQLAYEYWCEAALVDLDDLQHNSRDGLHMASLAGAWIGAVSGFGGLRDHDGVLSFAPRLPEQLHRLCFRLCVRGRRLKVEITGEGVSYSVQGEKGLAIVHDGEELTVDPDRPVRRNLAAAPDFPAPCQIPGREPSRHRARA